MAGKWTAADIPDQTGRLAVVTGSNSGLGLITAQELARAGATVMIACRNLSKGEQAAQRIRNARALRAACPARTRSGRPELRERILRSPARQITACSICWSTTPA